MGAGYGHSPIIKVLRNNAGSAAPACVRESVAKQPATCTTGGKPCKEIPLGTDYGPDRKDLGNAIHWLKGINPL